MRESRTITLPDGTAVRFVVDDHLPDGVVMAATNRRLRLEVEAVLQSAPAVPPWPCLCASCAPDLAPEQDSPPVELHPIAAGILRDHPPLTPRHVTDEVVAKALADHERAVDEILAERDKALEQLDAILDLVLGTDRPEWSSAYDFADAQQDAEEEVARLHRIVDAANTWADGRPATSTSTDTALLSALGRLRRRSTDGGAS